MNGIYLSNNGNEKLTVRGPNRWGGYFYLHTCNGQAIAIGGGRLEDISKRVQAFKRENANA